MEKRPYHHGALEAGLLQAAMDVVTTHGTSALALRDLARTLGVSPAATYRHFPSRDHLLAAVSQQARQQLAVDMIAARDAVPADGDPATRSVQRFAATGRAYIGFAVRSPHLFETAFVACAVPPPPGEDPRAWSVLVEAVDEMIETGAILAARRADAPLIAWAGVHGLSTILTASVRPPDSTIGAGHEPAIDTVIDGIIRAIR